MAKNSPKRRLEELQEAFQVHTLLPRGQRGAVVLEALSQEPEVALQHLLQLHGTLLIQQELLVQRVQPLKVPRLQGEKA